MGIPHRIRFKRLPWIIVTKHGRPVAVLSPPPTPEEIADAFFGFMKESIDAPEDFDFTAPVLDELLDAAEGRLHR